MDNFSYDKDSLKVQLPETSSEETKEKHNIATKNKEKPMSNRKAALIVVMLIVMYAMISTIPTFIMMYFFDMSFWLSQIIVIIGIVIATFVFDLHKPASNEQKLKSKFLL